MAILLLTWALENKTDILADSGARLKNEFVIGKFRFNLHFINALWLKLS